jgi:hypothetical protein
MFHYYSLPQVSFKDNLITCIIYTVIYLRVNTLIHTSRIPSKYTVDFLIEGLVKTLLYYPLLRPTVIC